MSATVPPGFPSPLAAALAAAQSSARGTVVSVPESVLLTQGQSLSAQVVSSGSGQLVLTTSLGRLTVQSSAALPDGASVLVQVQSVGATPQVTLHFQQNPTTAQGAAHGNVPAAGAPQGGVAAATQPIAPVVTELTEGSVLPATVTRAAAIPAAGAPATAASPATAAAAPAPATPAAPTQAAAPPVLAAGASLTVRVLAVAPPGGTLPAVPVAAAQPGAFVFPATVTAHQAGGTPVVTGDAVDLALPNAHSLPTGSRLLLEVVTVRPPSAGEPPPGLSFLGDRWETLNQALSALQQVDPALLRHTVETAIPTPGARLPGTLLFFLSAMFSGDVRRFLGTEAMRHLGRGTGSIGDRLSSEFSQLQRTATDAAGNDWRLFLIPILTEDGLEQLRFMLREHEEDGTAQEGETGTRFMIEVTMSRLGPFQFDGLTRQKHVDLVVRTQQELPPAMRDDIRSIFGNTVSALGFTGTIVLRTVPKFEISPIDDAPDSHKDVVV